MSSSTTEWLAGVFLSSDNNRAQRYRGIGCVKLWIERRHRGLSPPAAAAGSVPTRPCAVFLPLFSGFSFHAYCRKNTVLTKKKDNPCHAAFTLQFGAFPRQNLTTTGDMWELFVHLCKMVVLIYRGLVTKDDFWVDLTCLKFYFTAQYFPWQLTNSNAKDDYSHKTFCAQLGTPSKRKRNKVEVSANSASQLRSQLHKCLKCLWNGIDGI
mgnify:CR=1 FL=1